MKETKQKPSNTYRWKTHDALLVKESRQNESRQELENTYQWKTDEELIVLRETGTLSAIAQDVLLAEIERRSSGTSVVKASHDNSSVFRKYTAYLLAAMLVLIVHQCYVDIPPLHEAISSDSSINLRDIGDGTAVNMSHYLWGTPLEMAVTLDQPKYVEELILLGADLAPASANKLLNAAARHGKTLIAKYLIYAGTPVNPSHIQSAAGLWGREETLELFKYHYAMAKGIQTPEITPLHLSVSKGDLSQANKLISEGADPNARLPGPGAGYMYTPLHMATVRGNLYLVEALTNNGADINARTNDGVTPLHIAVSKNHVNIVEHLLSKEAYLNPRASDGGTPLDLAAYNGSIEIAQLLLSNGAYANSRNNGGFTALHQAARQDNRDMVELLVSQNAYIDSLDTTGQTPLNIACLMGFENVAEFLIAKGANIDIADNWGYTPLHMAVIERNKAIVKLLLDNDADVSKRSDDELSTPLHIAAGNGEKAIAILLMDNGANPYLPSTNGITPLDVANQMGHSEIVKFLRKNRDKISE